MANVAPSTQPAKVEKTEKTEKYEPRVEKAQPVKAADTNPSTDSAPPPASWEQHTYVVVRGDTAASVSKRFGVTENALMRANGLADGQWLPVGYRIVIPSRKPKHW